MNRVAKEQEQCLIQGEVKDQIDHWIQKFPSDKKQSAALSALFIVQEANGGYLTESAMNELADYLEMSRVTIYEVATFYTMYNHQPVGKYKIEVCTNLSCDLCGAKKIMEHLQNRLNIKVGEVTPDEKFSLHEAECLGACTAAPMFQIDDKYYENLTPERIDLILDELD